MNSLFLAVAGVLTNIFLGALAGYSFAKLKFKGRKTMFSLLLSSMMIPGVITMIPQFLVLKNFPLVGGNNIFGQGGQGFINHYAAIILPGAVGAYAVFFMKQFLKRCRMIWRRPPGWMAAVNSVFSGIFICR